MNGFEDLMIAEGAVVSGNVRCGKDCSIWYNARFEETQLSSKWARELMSRNLQFCILMLDILCI